MVETGNKAGDGDTGARELTTRFHRDGGVRDPVRVLAQIPGIARRYAGHDRPSFAVSGRDLCERRDSPGRGP